MKLIHAGAEMKHMVDLDKIKPGAVIVDAGASRWEFGLWFGSKVGFEYTYKMLEPAISNCNYLLSSLMFAAWIASNDQLHSDVLKAGWALGGKDDRVLFTEFRGENGRYHQWGNIYGNHRDEVDCPIDAYYVDVIGINSLHERLGVEYIDYLKMDIEGAELEVFREMKELTMRKIGQVSVEVHSNEARELILRQARRWRYNFIAEYGNEIFFTETDRRKPVQSAAV